MKYVPVNTDVIPSRATPDGMGRRRSETPTGQSPETERLVWLIEDLQAEHGYSQTKIGELLGISQGYVSMLLRGERGQAITTDIIRAARSNRDLRVDPDYFFAPYEGRRSYRDYLLDAQRQDVKMAKIEREISELRQKVDALRGTPEEPESGIRPTPQPKE